MKMCKMKTILAFVFALFLIRHCRGRNVRSGVADDTYTDTGKKEQCFGPEDTLWVSSQKWTA